MTKPAYCQKHGEQAYTMTSPALAAAIENALKINDDLFILQVESYGRVSEYRVNVEFIKKYIPVVGERVALLRDRDEGKKELNDRIIIQKIFKEMRWVCPVCLKDTLLKC